MTTSRKQRRYTPELRAKVLAVLTGNAGKVRKTSRETGVPPATIRMWRDNPDAAASGETREKARGDLAAEIDEVRWAYLERARERKAIATTSGYYAVQAVEKLTGIHALLTGGPTQRIDVSPWGRLLMEIRDSRLGALRLMPGPAERKDSFDA